jgi:hypothetical protein
LGAVHGQEGLHFGMRVERMLFLVEQVLLGDTKRGNPIGIVLVVPIWKFDKLPERSTMISANYGDLTH